ncbi:hypothetical protein BDW68DRAFT_178342 [Aspergillus falconensis]
MPYLYAPPDPLKSNGSALEANVITRRRWCLITIICTSTSVEAPGDPEDHELQMPVLRERSKVELCVEQNNRKDDKKTIVEKSDNFILNKDGRVTDIVPGKTDIDLDREFVIVRTIVEPYTLPIHEQIKAIGKVDNGTVVGNVGETNGQGISLVHRVLALGNELDPDYINHFVLNASEISSVKNQELQTHRIARMSTLNQEQ